MKQIEPVVQVLMAEKNLKQCVPHNELRFCMIGYVAL